MIQNKTTQAILTGSVEADYETQVSDGVNGVSENFSQNPYQNGLSSQQVVATLSSINVQEGEKVLLTYIYISSYSNNNQTGANIWSIQRDTVQQTTFANGNFSGNCIKALWQYLDDPGPGNYVYRCVQTETSDLDGYQWCRLVANVIKADDTHAASAVKVNSVIS